MKILDNQREIFKVSSALPHTMTLAEREELGGVQKIFEFPNGYGASVVIHDFFVWSRACLARQRP